ncbi:hypothetical protein SAY87_005407 [Trapa incisa]|uniref:Uncharacterized protein n=1 Tax=Trapa incisa TaxID=236973 RepID=A0AAN7K8S5_9MYRT|nr:hypothetical protein SAY87_005407 [Trapa incisa]
MVMGFMLWTPKLIPKDCFINLEEGHLVVSCRSDEALHRAKSLVNIEFSSFLVVITVFSVSTYLVLTRIYGSSDRVQYQSIDRESDDIELSSTRFIHDVGKISSHSGARDMGR